MNIWSYTFMAVIIMLFMQFAGFPTGLNSVLDFIGLDFATNNSVAGFNITISNFWEFIFNATTGVFASVAFTGVAIGLLATGRADIAIFAAIVTSILVLFIPTIAFAVIYAIESGFSPWVTALLAMIFIPLTVGYVIALFKYIGGGQ